MPESGFLIIFGMFQVICYMFPLCNMSYVVAPEARLVAIARQSHIREVGQQCQKEEETQTQQTSVCGGQDLCKNNMMIIRIFYLYFIKNAGPLSAFNACDSSTACYLGLGLHTSKYSSR